MQLRIWNKLVTSGTGLGKLYIYKGFPIKIFFFLTPFLLEQPSPDFRGLACNIMTVVLSDVHPLQMFCKCLKCIFSLFHVNASVSNFPEGHLDWFRLTKKFCLSDARKLKSSYVLQMIDHKIAVRVRLWLETWAASMCLCHLNGEQVFFANREGGWVGGWLF